MPMWIKLSDRLWCCAVLEGHESMTPGIMILDELDSGVGGRLGAPVGRMLRRMVLPQAGGRAATSQILCVSHLPQVKGRRAG